MAKPITAEIAASAFPWPAEDTHKHARGRLAVVSGRASSTGAARLAARAGLRVGAGVVRVCCPPSAALVLSVALEAVMVTPFTDPAALADAVADHQALVIGPGNGLRPEIEARLAALAGPGLRRVVDADALSWFAGRPADLAQYLGPGDVVTPHTGEFERLFPAWLDEGRETAARRAAEALGCTVLLKGHQTLVAGPAGDLWINTSGTPWLATAGTGDVLAGLIGGLLAQGLEPAMAAACAAWLHGQTARHLGPGLIAEDLPDALLAILRQMHDRRSGNDPAG